MKFLDNTLQLDRKKGNSYYKEARGIGGQKLVNDRCGVDDWQMKSDGERMVEMATELRGDKWKQQRTAVYGIG